MPLQVPDELRDLADHVEVVQQVLQVLVQLPGPHVDLVCKQANPGTALRPAHQRPVGGRQPGDELRGLVSSEEGKVSRHLKFSITLYSGVTVDAQRSSTNSSIPVECPRPHRKFELAEPSSSATAGSRRVSAPVPPTPRQSSGPHPPRPLSPRAAASPPGRPHSRSVPGGSLSLRTLACVRGAAEFRFAN